MWNRSYLCLLCGTLLIQATAYTEALPNFGFAQVRSELVPGQNFRHQNKGTPEQRQLKALSNRPLMKQAYENLMNSVSGLKVEFSRLGGGASFVFSITDHLSAATQGTPEQVARAFIKSHKNLFGATVAEVDAMVVTKVYQSPFNNIQHVHLHQEIGGIKVMFSGLKVHMTEDGRVISVNGHFIPDLASQAEPLPADPVDDARQSLQETLDDLQLTVNLPAISQQPTGPDKALVFAKGDDFDKDIEGRLVYLPSGSGKVAFGWQFGILARNDPNMYLSLCNCVTKRIVARYNFTSQADGLVYDRDSPTPDSPHGGQTNPPLVNRVLREFDARDNLVATGAPAFNSTDPHFDWYAAGSQTTTVSNNVKAGDDRGNDDDPALVSGTGTSNNNYSFGDPDSSVLLALAPNQYTSAAVVNLFYWCNRIHDFLYIHGFDEASGNFQTSNFGLGGLEGDVIRAEAQDGSNINNANMLTLPDGTESRMQMFETTGQNPRRDTDFDNQIIIHEYGHGLSNRLINDSIGLAGTQPRSLGEGWGDIIALLMLSEPGDDLTEAYPLGGYSFLGVDGTTAASGSRTEPYSANPAIYTRRFGNLFQFGSPHGAGEIWCNALFMGLANMKQTLGSNTQAVSRLTRIIIEGLKLTPTNPTFIQARDAVLLAEANTFSGQHQADLQTAFATMGMGFFASTPGPTDTTTVEDFTVDPAITGDSFLTLDKGEFSANPPPAGYLVGDQFVATLRDGNTTGNITAIVTAQFSGDQETITFIPDTTPGVFDGALPMERRFQNGVTQNDGTLQCRRGDIITITYQDADDGSGTPKTLVRELHIGLPEVVMTEDFDDGTANGWQLDAPWAVTAEDSSSSPNSLTDSPGGDYAINLTINATMPLLDGANLRDLSLTFNHKFDLESGFDFGLIIIQDVDGTRTVGSFTGVANSSFQTVTVPLGDPATTGSVQISFQLNTDSSVVTDGWHIDDVVLSGVRTVAGPLPIITSISPASIPVNATTRITITGSNLTTKEDVKISIGGIQATIVSASPTQVLADITVPNGTLGITSVRRGSSQGITRASSEIDIVVETSDGTATSTGGASFTNNEPPDTGATPGNAGKVTSAQGGGCFVATAAYGSALQSELETLRRFRNERLIPAKVGDAFTRTYYANSPTVARRIRGSSLLRAFSRKCLTPAVKCAGINQAKN